MDYSFQELYNEAAEIHAQHMNEQIQIEKKQREEINRHEAIRMEQERFQGLWSKWKVKQIQTVGYSNTFLFHTLRQITFSQELRWGQNKLIATQCSEWNKRVLTKDTDRNNLKHKNVKRMKETSIVFTRHERVMGEGGGEERKTFTFLSRTRILDHRFLRSEFFLRFLVNESWHTEDT